MTFENNNNDELFPGLDDQGHDDGGHGNDAQDEGQQYVPLTEFQTVQGELAKMQQWQQNAMRAFGGQNDNQANQHQQDLEFMIQNPAAFRAQVAQEGAQMAMAQFQLMQMQNNFQTQNNDLAPFQDYIFNDANFLQQQHRQNGQFITDSQALQMAADNFRKKLPGQGGMPQPNTNPNTMREMTYKMDTGRTQPNSGGNQIQGNDPFYSMPADQFEQVRQRVRQTGRF